MKREIRGLVTVAIVFGVLLVIILIGNLNLTGFVTLSADLNNTNTTMPFITQEMARGLIEQAKTDIETMKSAGFSTIKVGDILIEAEKAMQVAQYAGILRNEINSTEAEKSEARKALALVNWNSVNYSAVYVSVHEISSRKEQAFLLNDKLTLKENELASTDSAVISLNTKQILENAKVAFRDERYDETQSLLDEFQLSLEKDQEKASTLSGITFGTKNFIQRYWVAILIIAAILIWILQIALGRYRISSIKNKIEKMKFENTALNEIIKKTQTERFKDNKISSLIYNIRMKKYQERTNEIKETLPVLEEELKKLLK